MASEFSRNQNILQPKRLNSGEGNRVQAGLLRQDGPKLTLNGVTIDLPSNFQHMGSFDTVNKNTVLAKKGSNAMAKRNARERNRVKQVNQGFQTLRQHIPDSFRMKKMSKVDTLRCALDYIQSMEHVLKISPKLPSLNKEFLTDSSYQRFSSRDMDQHLGKICSVEETRSISPDQSFSSFCENEESSTQGSHNSSYEEDDQSFFLLSSSEYSEACQPIDIVTSEGNTSQFHSLVAMPSSSTPSIILPVHLHSHSQPMMEDNRNMIQSNENEQAYSSSTPFIRVLEMVQLKQ